MNKIEKYLFSDDRLFTQYHPSLSECLSHLVNAIYNVMKSKKLFLFYYFIYKHFNRNFTTIGLFNDYHLMITI